MPRKANQAETVHIRISTTRQVQTYLERLVAEGTFGKNISEAAERLLATKLNEMMGSNRLPSILTGRGP